MTLPAFPTRFHTGVRNVTIPNPAWLHDNYSHNAYGPLRKPGKAQTFQGLCSDYNFKLQTKNFEELQKVLKRNGTDFLYVAAATYKGDYTNHRFVACSADGSLVWNKYVGFIAQSGQNHVYVGGMRIKVSIFLKLQPQEQDALLSGSRSRIQLMFDEKKIAWLDESRSLWN